MKSKLARHWQLLEAVSARQQLESAHFQQQVFESEFLQLEQLALALQLKEQVFSERREVLHLYDSGFEPAYALEDEPQSNHHHPCQESEAFSGPLNCPAEA